MTTSAKVRLVLAAALFLGWISWLAYLVYATRRDDPIVLSRPQFLVSTLDVIALVPEHGDEAKVEEVFFPSVREAGRVGQTIRVDNLSHCRGWHGAGLYILPLVKVENEVFRVPSIPHSPGFPSTANADAPRVYPVRADTRRQLQEIDSRKAPAPVPAQ